MGENAESGLFFEAPEHRGMKAGDAQINLNGGTIQATGFDENKGIFEMPGFYLLGSPTMETSVDIKGNPTGVNEFVIYGPNTTMNVTGNATYIGVIAGKNVNVTGSGLIKQPKNFKPPVIGGATVFARQSYVECMTGTSSPPDAGC